MLVLHAAWDNDRFFLWAESSSLPPNAHGNRGRQPNTKKLKSRAHPFSLARDELREAIERISGNFSDQTSPKFETKKLLIPSAKKGPLPSPWLIREEDYNTEKATGLAEWDIETLIFDPYSTFDLLLGLPEDPPHGFVFGSSLRFWIEVAKFSLELIIREQFIPSIQEKDGSFRALWEMAIGEEDEERVLMLSKAMPPSCRASPTSQLPVEMVLTFINRTIDAFIRKKLSSTLLIPPHRGRPPKVLPLPQQWLRALSTDNPTLVAPPGELNAFSNKIHTWLVQLQPTVPDASFRTCFRLDPPGEEETEGWKIRFFLQAKDDRSLLVPADEIWKTRSSTLTLLKRRFKNPQEQFLADLGKASRLFPPIESHRLFLNRADSVSSFRHGGGKRVLVLA